MRLTNKMGIAYEVEDFTNCYECVDKLGQLEDVLEKYKIDIPQELDKDLEMCHRLVYEYGQIEEELGIDLKVFVKMTLGTIVYVKHNDMIGCEGHENGVFAQPWNEYWYYQKEKVFCIYLPELETRKPKFYIKDYGKTWALTNEELL